GAVEGEDAVDDGFQFAGGGPLEGGLDVGTVAAVAADEAVLFHEEGPEVELHVATSSRGTSDDAAATGEALEDLGQDIAADVLDDEIHAAFASEAAHFGG